MEDPVRTESQEESEDTEDAENAEGAKEEASVISLSCRYAVILLCLLAGAGRQQYSLPMRAA